MTIFYFTATGNSLAVAKSIADETDGNLISIPQIIDSDSLRYKDDAIGIVFPIYSWTLPFMVRHFIDNAAFETNYLFAIGTYGSIAGGAMAGLQKRFDYTEKLLMLDNFLPMFEINAQKEKLPKKGVEENTAKIVKNIKNRERGYVKVNVGAKIMTKLVGGMFKPAKNAKKYIINDKCNNCGVCVKVCPSKNIVLGETIRFDEHCEGCLACVHLCPQNALHLKNEKSDKRWRNPSVSLNEIIEANNRGS